MKRQSFSTFALPNSKPTQHLGVRVGEPPQDKHIRVVVHLKKGAIDRSLRVERFATEHGVKVEELKESEGKVVLNGTVGAIERAFNVKLARYKFRGYVYRVLLTAVHVPEDLVATVKRVSGLNTFQVAKKKSFSSTHVLPNSTPKHPGTPAGVPPVRKLIQVRVSYRKDAKRPVVRIRGFAAHYGLKVVRVNRRAGRVVLSGTVGAIEKTFNTALSRYRFQGRIYRTNTKPVHVPRFLKNVVKGVIGLRTLRGHGKGGPLPASKPTKSIFNFSIPSHVVPGTGPKIQLGERIGIPPPNKQIQISVYVRRKPQSLNYKFVSRDSYLLPQERVYLNRIQLGRQSGARSSDLNKIKAFAQQHHIKVVEINPAQRKVVLEGSIKQLEKTFGVTLGRYKVNDKLFRSNVTPVMVPAQLSKIVSGVFGFDTQPIAQPHFKSLAASAFNVTKVAQLYQFPTMSKGKGECIGIIELAGGYRQADLDAFFKGEGISPSPQVVPVGVDGHKNAPTGNPTGPDCEVCLDIEVAGAVAPRSKIAVYFAPNTSRGFIDAIMAAVHDRTHRPTILSISWGSAEKFWQGQTLKVMNQAFQDAAAIGITVLCASGDSGSSDGVNDGQNHVDYPASSPFVMGCGGTHLQASGNTISRETAWSGSGGGFSAVFPVPVWQTGIPAHAKGRGVPDVAGDAAPGTGYRVRVDGRRMVVGGTSAVAPLWAGLLARVNSSLSASYRKAVRVGFLNPLLYSKIGTDGSLRDITAGSNGSFKAAKGWDPVTGWGSFKGTTLLSNINIKGKPGKPGKPGGTPGPGKG
jgi:kumamolisin